MTVEQWNRDGGTVEDLVVEQTVQHLIMEQWKRDDGTVEYVMVEQCNLGSGTKELTLVEE